MTMTQLEDPVAVADAPDLPGLRFRRYRGEADVRAIVDLITAGRYADGVDWLPSLDELRLELANPVNEDPFRDLIVAEVDGRMAAYARARWSLQGEQYVYFTECEVHPEFRRRGLGRALLHAEQRRLREIAATHPADATKTFQTWTLEEQVGADALLRSEGYEAVRFFVEMSRPLDGPIAAVPLPQGLELRPMEPGQDRQIFDAEAEAFRDHWGHREWTDADFERTFQDPHLDRSLWRVAWDGDEVAGVVDTVIPIEENEALGRKRGWLERISVRRPWRRRGVAGAIVTSALIGLRERGYDEAALGVDADNPTGAFQLYEKLGFRLKSRATTFARPLDGSEAG